MRLPLAALEPAARVSSSSASSSSASGMRVAKAARPFAAAAVAAARRRQLRGVHTQRAAAAGAQQTAELPASLKKIVGAFQMVPDPMVRYKQLLFYANKLAPLPSEDHNSANKVEGCVSQLFTEMMVARRLCVVDDGQSLCVSAVWVKPEVRDDGRVYWSADSDSQLTKGLAALLVLGLSGCTPAEILKIQPIFIEMLGLKQSLTPSRNNGFLNMFLLMQRKSLELATKQDGAA